MMMRKYALVLPIQLYWLLLWTTHAVAQDSTTCLDLLTSFASCLVDTFDSQSDAAACDSCRLEASALVNNSTDFLSCNDVETIECGAVRDCPCNECGPVLESYLNCEVVNNYNNNQCPSGIDCRTSVVNCESAFDGYRNCIYRLPITSSNNSTTTTTDANGKMCDDCRLGVANQFLDGGTCDAAQTNFCTGVNDTCASVCGDCIDELDFFFTCDVLDKSNGNCQINCNTTLTPPISDEPFCSDDLSEFAFCITQDLPSEADGVACDNCRINGEASILETPFSTVDTCTNIQQVVCNNVVPTCADICGTCTASLAGYWICYSAIKSFADCSTTNCNSISSPSAPNPVAVPTINPPLGSPLSVPVRGPSVPTPEISPTTSATVITSVFNGLPCLVLLAAMYCAISQ